MTTFNDVEIKCSVCGKTSTELVIGSSTEMGYRDLDTRPSPMFRNTIIRWVNECPSCGYVARSLEDELTINNDYLNSEQYKTCDGMEFKSNLSECFYKLYLIEKEKSDDDRSFFAMLHCVWSCDDAGDSKNSKLTRQLAIKIADKLIKSKIGYASDLILIKADLLRRIGEFDLLIEEYENLTLGDELSDNIINFQVEKAHQRDSSRYTLEEISSDNSLSGGIMIFR